MSVDLSYTAGVDEAGRGPLAGPVVAAAVILNPAVSIEGLKDSKQLTPKQRYSLYEKIIKNCLAFGIAKAEVEEIDEINILQASLLAMQRAILKLLPAPTLILVDGTFAPKLPISVQAIRTIVKGDQTVPCISAASILAKVFRDREMIELAKEYPHYGFDRHMGYGTKAHLESIQKWGACKLHRRSFKPVRMMLNQGGPTGN